MSFVISPGDNCVEDARECARLAPAAVAAVVALVAEFDAEGVEPAPPIEVEVAPRLCEIEGGTDNAF